MNSQTQSEKEAIIERKIRHRVARKVIHDLHQRSEEIEQQVRGEKRASRIILPIVLGIGIVVVLMLLWPFILKSLSTLLNGA